PVRPKILCQALELSFDKFPFAQELTCLIVVAGWAMVYEAFFFVDVAEYDLRNIAVAVVAEQDAHMVSIEFAVFGDQGSFGAPVFLHVPFQGAYSDGVAV